MQALMDLIQEIDGNYYLNMHGAHGAIADFITSIIGIMNSFGAEIFMTSAMIDEIARSKSPIAIKGMMASMISEKADRKMAEVERMGLATRLVVALNSAINRAGEMQARLEWFEEVRGLSQLPNMANRENWSRYFTDPDFNSFLAGNPNIVGNCTWFAEGRVQELTGIAPQWSRDEHDNIIGSRHGHVWIHDDRILNGTTSNLPSFGAIMVWGTGVGGGFGHVAVVEAVHGTTIYFSEANWPSMGDNGFIRSQTMNQLNADDNFLGFVHLHNSNDNRR